jgi:glycosyltransferase involved in cell wall biosynthesis
MSDKVRILYLHHQSKMGGAERSLLTLFSGLDGLPYDIHVACPPDGPFSSSIEKRGYGHFPVEFSPLRRIGRLVRNTSTVVGLVKSHHIHLVHSNGPQTNLPCGIASRMAKVPVVWHARNLLGKGMRDLDRSFSALADRIICNSHAIGRRFEGIKKFEQKVSVVINAVDNGLMAERRLPKNDARRLTGLPSQDFIVGLFDRLDPSKNHDTVVRALAAALRTCPNILLLIVGEAFERHEEMSDALMRLAGEYGVQDRLRLMGYRKDVFDWMSACDVVVQAAEREGCSRVLCEAQAIGRPVLAARDGGNVELVEHEKTGLLFEVNDVEELARHLCRLYASPDAAAQMGAAGVEKAERDFSLSRYVEQTTGIYRSLLV